MTDDNTLTAFTTSSVFVISEVTLTSAHTSLHTWYTYFNTWTLYTHTHIHTELVEAFW